MRILVAGLMFLLFAEQLQAQVLYYKPSDNSLLQKKFSKTQVAEDMDFMLHVIKQAHVNMYHDISKKELQDYQQEILSRLPDSLSLYQCSFAITPLLTALNEGHLGFVWHNSQYNAYNAYGRTVPYSIYDITPSALVISKDYSKGGKLEPLDSIVAINNIPVRLLVQKWEALSGGPDCWRQAQMKTNLGFWLFADSIRSPYQIRATHGGHLIDLTVDGISFPVSSYRVLNPNQALNIEYRILPDSTAYLNYWQMTGNKDKFTCLLDSIFTDIRKKGLHKLVIDLRSNGGGDSEFADILLSYVTREKYRLGALSMHKVSRPAKTYYLDIREAVPKGFGAILKLIPNGVVIKRSSGTERPKKREAFYQGAYCFLVGNRTFSSASMMVNAIQDYNLGTLIGSPLCEPANDYGEILRFMLPNTHLIANTSTNYTVRPNGDREDSNPVQPDIFVRSSKEDLINGRDGVLLAAIEWLNQHRN